MPWLALTFCAGAAAVLLLPALPSPAGLLPLAVAALMIRRRHAAFAALLAGFAWTALGAAQLMARDWPCVRDRELVNLTGVVALPATLRDGRVDFELRVIGTARSQMNARRLKLSWYEATAVPVPGEYWRLTARLRCRSGMSNPGAADRELELLRQRAGATGYLVSDPAPVRVADKPWRYPVQRLRARIAAAIAAGLPGSASVGVLQGLSVGMRGDIPDVLWEAFAATGVAHLMAISGLHVTGCALFVLLLLRACWRLPWCSRIAARTGIEMTVVVAVTATYASVAGASLPTLRTLVMVAIVALQRVLRRTLPMHATLALAAVLLIAADPLALASPGFWLSFVATAALLALIVAGTGWRARIVAFLRTQAAILVLLAPVLAISFGRLSLIAPVANAIAIPVFSVVLLPAILLATGLTALQVEPVVGVWRLLAGALDACWPWLVAASRLPGASWWPAAQPAWLVAGTGAVALIALLLPLRGLRVAAGVMLLAIVLGRGGQPERGAWTLTVLDVGQGLAAVVQTHRHALIFDTGPRWRGGSTAARAALLPFLRARGVRRIDRLVVSHDDSDHAGGVGTVREALQVAEVIAAPGAQMPGPSSPCRRGDRWNWDGVEFRVLHPAADARDSDNENSCAILVGGPGGQALLLADPQERAEGQLVSGAIAADVVLVPHHGSRTSSTPALIDAIGARLGIVSAGYGNRWGMPDAGVVARWRMAGTTVLDTAESGAITVRFASLPGRFQVAAQRRESRRWWQRGPAR